MKEYTVMKILKIQFVCFLALGLSFCQSPPAENQEIKLVADTTNFVWRTEMFADVQINRYIISGWERLSPQQRILTYYLVKAGMEGRDIMYDMNYRHNLEIRKVFGAHLPEL